MSLQTIRNIGRHLIGAGRFMKLCWQERLVARAQRQMVPYDLSAKRRIVMAHLYGTDVLGDELYPRDQSGGLHTDSGPMTLDEMWLAKWRKKVEAAFRVLADADFVELHMLYGERGFAATGDQRRVTTNPVVSSTSRQGQINEPAMRFHAAQMSGEDVSRLDPEVLRGALATVNDTERLYLAVLRSIAAEALADAADAVNRARFISPANRRLLLLIARCGHLVTAAQDLTVLHREFNGDEAAWQEHIAEQRRKQDIIIARYEQSSREIEAMATEIIRDSL